jgi:Yip1-like protein
MSAEMPPVPPAPPSPMLGSRPASMFQTWIDAVTKPNEGTYASIAASPNAKMSTAFLWVFIGALVEWFAAFLVQGTMMRQMLQQQGLGDQLPLASTTSRIVILICGAPIAAVISVVGFAIGAAIVQWVAKMFGGHGTFERMAYTLAAIAAPITIAQAVLVLLSAIPFVGLCFRIITILVSLYVIVLEIMAVKGVNGFGWGPAAGSVLIPGLVIGILCCCLAFGISALVGASLGNIFSSINQSLTP